MGIGQRRSTATRAGLNEGMGGDARDERPLPKKDIFERLEVGSEAEGEPCRVGKIGLQQRPSVSRLRLRASVRVPVTTGEGNVHVHSMSTRCNICTCARDEHAMRMCTRRQGKRAPGERGGGMWAGVLNGEARR